MTIGPLGTGGEPDAVRRGWAQRLSRMMLGRSRPLCRCRNDDVWRSGRDSGSNPLTSGAGPDGSNRGSNGSSDRPIWRWRADRKPGERRRIESRLPTPSRFRLGRCSRELSGLRQRPRPSNRPRRRTSPSGRTAHSPRARFVHRGGAHPRGLLGRRRTRLPRSDRGGALGRTERSALHERPRRTVGRHARPRRRGGGTPRLHPLRSHTRWTHRPSHVPGRGS